MHTAVLVPLKAFDTAKGRLGGVLTEGERTDLARRLATGVLAAADPLPIWVVTDDAGVAAFAADLGASVIHQERPGLNGAVTDGVEAIAADGIDRVLVAHGDLAHPGGLRAVAEVDADVVLVPDRHGDGTNVLVVPSLSGFTFAYGPGSFRAHRAEAARLRLGVTVVDGTDLGWDVDTPADLLHPDTDTDAGAVTSPDPPRSA